MVETDKKRVLATAISPYLDGLREEELIAMDSQAMVSLVNLVLHKGSERIVRKTKEQHLEDLVNSVARMNNLGMNPNFYKNVDPILLGLISCQTQTIAEIDELFQFYKATRHGGRLRDGKSIIDDFEDFSEEDFKNEMEFQLVNSPLRTWPSDETELREGKNWFTDALSSARQMVQGPDGRCGYRRGTFCTAQLSGAFSACGSAMSVPVAGIACFRKFSRLLKGCQECILVVCEAALPSEIDGNCQDLYDWVNED